MYKIQKSLKLYLEILYGEQSHESLPKKLEGSRDACYDVMFLIISWIFTFCQILPKFKYILWR